MIEVNGDDRQFSAWEQTIKQNLKPGVQAIVLILQGNKNNATLYAPLKKLLIETVPVPSQVVLANTISRGKNLRSIVNKIFMQISAKIGCVPWAISDLPLSDKPISVIGYDVHHKKKQQSTLGFCSSNNRTCTRYFTQTRQQECGEEIASSLEELVTNAIVNFRETNGNRAPERLFFMRDGVGDS